MKAAPTGAYELGWALWIDGKERKKGEPCTIVSQAGTLVCVRFEDGTTRVLNRLGVRASKVGEVREQTS